VSKVIVAITDIKHNDIKIKAGDPIPVDQFDKDTLLKLYEIGSIDKVERDDEVEKPGLTKEDLKDAGTKVAAPKVEEPPKVVEPDPGTPKVVEETSVAATDPSKPAAKSTSGGTK